MDQLVDTKHLHSLACGGYLLSGAFPLDGKLQEGRSSSKKAGTFPVILCLLGTRHTDCYMVDLQ